uniref:Uncharacterized protein n=1 Tax=Lactuca sativa TaxID=4236 RepID=A0A9R1VQQ3_LACSA|nr:hypothetical protein LSAT_V11C400219440 [Lactuca sativa]
MFPPQAGNSANVDDIEIASHETKSLKDAISQIGDNLTPSMPDKFEVTSPFKFNSPLVYDNVNSSTKVAQLNSTVDGHTSLLIPKLENIAHHGVHYSNIDSHWFIFTAILYLK